MLSRFFSDRDADLFRPLTDNRHFLPLAMAGMTRRRGGRIEPA